MVFAREINGQELTFGVSGKLIMNAVVLYDRQTDTLWSQFLATAVDGPLVGTKLELIPAQLTTWEAWTAQFSDTKLLDRQIGGGRGFRDGYESYYKSRSTGVLGQSNKDPRLPDKELIIGLDHGRERKAYAFSALRDEPVVNDTYELDPIVVTFDSESGGAGAFSSTVEGEALTFEFIDLTTMRDAQTGSIWSSARGVALSGPLAGAELERLPSFVSFWFAWTDFYPGTDLYEPGLA